MRLYRISSPTLDLRLADVALRHVLGLGSLAHLAHYRAPRHLVVVDTIGRAPNGKVDYRRLTGVAVARLGSS